MKKHNDYAMKKKYGDNLAKREIRFRGKTFAGVWLIGSLTCCKDMNVCYITPTSGRESTQVIAGTVGQLTPFVDRHDTPIFEGHRVLVAKKGTYHTVTFCQSTGSFQCGDRALFAYIDKGGVVIQDES